MKIAFIEHNVNPVLVLLASRCLKIISIINVIIIYMAYWDELLISWAPAGHILTVKSQEWCSKWSWELIWEVIVLVIFLPSNMHSSNNNSWPANVSQERSVSWSNKNSNFHLWRICLLLDSRFPKSNIKQTKDHKCMDIFCSWAINHNLKRLVSVGSSYLISALVYCLAAFIYLLVIIISPNEYNFIVGRSSANLPMSFLEYCWTYPHFSETCKIPQIKVNRELINARSFQASKK